MNPIKYLSLSYGFTAALLGARFRSADSCLTNDDGLEGNGPLDVPAGCNMGRRRSRAVLYQLSGHYVSTYLKSVNYDVNSFSLLYSSSSCARNRRKLRLN